MADYTSLNDREGKFSRFLRFRNTKPDTDYTDPEKNLPLELKRTNSVWQKRAEQMEINTLAVTGGREYVDARLSRFSGESNIDWEGGVRADGGRVDGRKQQSHCFPYPARITDKISQHVFSDRPERDTIADYILNDASADGCSLDELMRKANDYVTSCGWCWLGVDSPTIEGQVSRADKVAKKIRPYIQVYSPLEVVDWKFNAIGELDWLITESDETSATLPEEPEACYKVRRIWTRGAVRIVRMEVTDKGEKIIVSDEESVIGYSGVPFVLVGSISAGGHAFDDIESVNRTIMDLESVNRANFYKRCFPQMVLPNSCISNVSDAFSSAGLDAAELIVGLNYPILVSKDDPMPMYLMPAAADMGALRSELQQLKHNMFEAVGLMLQSESRQVASAESKAWDYLDVSMVMKARAAVLEDAENKAAKIIHEWDGGVPEWTAVYNRHFDIGDFEQEMNALITAVNTSMPAEMYRLILHKILDRIDRLGSSVTPEERKVIEDAINGFSPNTLSIGVQEDFGAPEPT